MFLLDSVKRSLAKVVSYSQRVIYKAYDIFSSLFVSIFAQIILTVIWSMYFINAKKFVIVGDK